MLKILPNYSSLLDFVCVVSVYSPSPWFLLMREISVGRINTQHIYIFIEALCVCSEHKVSNYGFLICNWTVSRIMPNVKDAFNMTWSRNFWILYVTWYDPFMFYILCTMLPLQIMKITTGFLAVCSIPIHFKKGSNETKRIVQGQIILIKHKIKSLPMVPKMFCKVVIFILNKWKRRNRKQGESWKLISRAQVTLFFLKTGCLIHFIPPENLSHWHEHVPSVSIAYLPLF